MEYTNDLKCLKLENNNPNFATYLYCGRITVENVQARLKGEFSGKISDLSASDVAGTRVINMKVNGDVDGQFNGSIIVDLKDQHQGNVDLLSFLESTRVSLSPIADLLERLIINDAIVVFTKSGAKTIGDLVNILSNRSLDYLFDDTLRKEIILKLNEMGVNISDTPGSSHS